MLSPARQWAELGVNATVNCTVTSVSERPALIMWSKLSLPQTDNLNSLPRYQLYTLDMLNYSHA